MSGLVGLPDGKFGFVVKYGRDGSKFRYAHSYTSTLDEAKRDRDRWYEGGGWGGVPQEEFRVWVEDRATGKVVYGVAATRAA